MNLLKRCFLNIENIEIEVCKDVSGIYFVRHHAYWSIAHGKKNPDLVYDCITYNLELMVNNGLSTIKFWLSV